MKKGKENTEGGVKNDVAGITEQDDYVSCKA